jgi:hypothetical protein
MFKRVLSISLSAALLAAPALAQPTPVSPLTVTPKAGAVTPPLKCADQECVLTVLKQLKANYPREYQNLMRWCMANDSYRMAFMTSDLKDNVPGAEVASSGGGDSSLFSPSANEKLVCDDRFRK